MSTARFRTLGMVVLLAALNLFGTPVSLAADAPVAAAYSLTTSPVSLNLAGKPGSKVTGQIRVRNDASKAQQLAVTASKFQAEGEEGKAILIEPKDDPSLSWVSFSPQKFEAEPGAWTTINVTFDLPGSAAFGYYYAIKISPQSAPTPEAGKTAYSGSNAVLVLLDAVSPNAKRTLRVDTFEAAQGVYEYLPANFTTRLENTGNVHAAPAGNIFILQNGKQLAMLDFNKAGGNVLPNSKRVFTSTWSDGFPVSVVKTDANGSPVRDKAGNVVTNLKWDFSQLGKLRFGKFTAKFVGAYPDNNGNSVELDASVDFWVIPWRLILIALAILLFTGIGIYATFAKAAQRAKHRRAK